MHTLSKTTLALATFATLSLVAMRPAAAQVSITNSSFETDTATGYQTITGWVGSAGGGSGNPTSGGGYGLDTGGGAFANTGTIPDGRNVAYLQAVTATTTLSQSLSGFTVNHQYVVTFFDNARSYRGDASLSVSLGGVTIVPATSIAPVGGTNPYNFVTSSAFTATGSTATLVFSSLATSSGDTTALIDNVKIRDITAAPEPSQSAAFAIGLLGLGALALKARKRSLMA